MCVCCLDCGLQVSDAGNVVIEPVPGMMVRSIPPPLSLKHASVAAPEQV